MAGYKWHIFVSLLLVVAVALIVNYFMGFYPFGWLDWLILIPIIIFYAMLPDVDHPNSKIRGFVFSVFFVGFIVILAGIAIMVHKDMPKVGIYIAAGFGILQAFLALIIMAVKHRGAIHTIIAGAIFALPLLYFFSYNWLYFMVACLAYAGHLAVDGDFGN